MGKDRVVNAAKNKQVGILVRMHPELLDAVDRAMNALGLTDRTAFIRMALYEHCERAGITPPAYTRSGPDRRGIGGRPTHKAQINSSTPPVTPAPALPTAIPGAPQPSAAHVPIAVDYTRVPDRTLDELLNDTPRRKKPVS